MSLLLHKTTSTLHISSHQLPMLLKSSYEMVVHNTDFGFKKWYNMSIKYHQPDNIFKAPLTLSLVIDSVLVRNTHRILRAQVSSVGTKTARTITLAFPMRESRFSL